MMARLNFPSQEALERFFTEMVNRGYRVTRHGYYRPDAIPTDDVPEMAYQAQNYECCNVTFIKPYDGINRGHQVDVDGKDYRQTIAVDYTGDEWCDVVPIVDWTYQPGRPDVVSEIVKSIRIDILGDDA